MSVPAARTMLGARFVLDELLKEGLGVRTWLGLDRSTREAVVVRTVDRDSLPLAARLRLEHEGRVLQDLSSPWIPPLLHLGEEEGQLYLVTPFLKGVTLSRRLQDGPLSTCEALAVGRSLFSALEAVHRLGVLHRDIKPGNLVLHGSPEVEGATLLDFGLARGPHLRPDLRDIPAGTALYLAPEQVGFLARDVGEGADLYSGGIVLFECLLGRPPFQGLTVGEVLRGHVAAAAPSLRSLGVEVPRALDEIIQRLLRKDPARRYQSAEGVLADLAELQEALCRGDADSVVVGRFDQRRSLADPAFVGRSSELDLLQEAVDRASEGGGLVLLEAPSGGGKSRLLEELALRALEKQVPVFRGGAHEFQAQVPLQILAGVADDLALSPDLVQLREELPGRLGDRCGAVAEALPRLASLLGAEAVQPQGPEDYGEVRTVRALRGLLDALGSPSRPALVLLDDGQWAGGVSLRVLRSWAEGLRNDGSHTVVVFAFRSEEVGPDHPILSLPAAHRLRLPPLTREDLGRLVESMAGSVPEEVREIVERLSEGSPFAACELLRGMAESGVLRQREETWILDARALESLQASHRAAALLARRLEALPPANLEVLCLSAVLGKEFGLDLVTALTGADASGVIGILDDARRRGLLWARSGGARFAFVHDRLREALLDRLGQEQRRALHRRAAEVLEEGQPGRIFDLAYHFDEAGSPERALPYALAAAAEARTRFATDRAAENYRIAARGAKLTDPAARVKALEGLGDVQMLAGRYSEAAEALEEAGALASDPTSRARIEGKLGELAFKRGDLDEASRLLQGALARLGRPVPGGALSTALGLAWEAGFQALHSLFPGRMVGRRPAAVGEARLLAAHLYNRLSYAWWFEKPTAALLWAHLRHMNLAEGYSPTPTLAQAYANHGAVMTNLPWFSRGVDYAHRGLEVRRALGDRWGEGQSLSFLGLVLYAASRLRDARESLEEAITILEQTGDLWELNMAGFHAGLCRYRLGDPVGALKTSRGVHRGALEIGDPQIAGISLNTLAKVNDPEVGDSDILENLAAVPADRQTTAMLLEARGIRLLARGRVDEAVAVLEEGTDLARRAGKRNEYVSSLPAWLGTALRIQAEAATVCPQARRASLERAGKALATALALARRFRNNLPHVLRELGVVACLQGRQEQGSRCLARSLAVAEDLQMGWERVLTLRERARLGRAFGWRDGDRDDREFRAGIAAMGVGVLPAAPLPVHLSESSGAREGLSLADRLARLQASGRRVVTALTREDVFEAVREAALSLLRGQECQVLEVRNPEKGVEAPEGTFSRSLVTRALARGRAVTMDGILPAAPSDSLLFTNIRSALACPILQAGDPVACVYLTHGLVDGLFREEEEGLLEFLATLAGASLESIEAHNEILLERERGHATELELRAVQDRKDALAGFLGIASHDLRNLLGVTRLFAYRLSPDLTPEDMEHSRSTIDLTCRRAESLIQLYLDAARLESGATLALSQSCFDLAVLVREEVDFQVRCLVAEFGRPPTLETRIESVSVQGDRERVRQVLANLLGNALAFTPPGGTVQVTLESSEEGARVCVRDQGPGVPMEMIPRLFQPYERLGNTSKGTGLGLWIARVVVEAHGGRIGVDHHDEGGCTFWFQLPTPACCPVPGGGGGTEGRPGE